MAMNTFDRAVSSIRRAVLNRVKSNGIVSPVDINKVARTIGGSSRGAAVRTAFRQLVEERMIRATNKKVYNPSTHHSVTVYGKGRKFS